MSVTNSLIPEMGDHKALLEKIFEHVRHLPASEKVDQLDKDLKDLATRFTLYAQQVDKTDATVKLLWEHHLVNQQAFQDLISLRNKIWAIGVAAFFATVTGGAAAISALKP